MAENYEHVNHPSHYNNYRVEVIEMMLKIYGKQAVIDFCEMNAFKYRMRAGTKPGQEARSVLPNSLKTEINVSANIREWRHILKLRTPHQAHPQMRELMRPLLEDLKSRIPILFDDIIY